MTLAANAGIRAAKTRSIRLVDGHAVAVLRFDRHGGGQELQRLHAQSAHVADGEFLLGHRSDFTKRVAKIAKGPKRKR